MVVEEPDTSSRLLIEELEISWEVGIVAGDISIDLVGVGFRKRLWGFVFFEVVEGCVQGR